MDEQAEVLDGSVVPSRITLHAREKPKKEAIATRIIMVWVVYNQWLKEQARFPFKERHRAEAFAEFAQDHCLRGDKYFVNPVRVEMEQPT